MHSIVEDEEEQELFNALVVFNKLMANKSFKKFFNIQGGDDSELTTKKSVSQSEIQEQKEETLKYKNISIKKRNDNRYMARFRYQGKQYSVYGKTQQDCYVNLKRRMTETFESESIEKNKKISTMQKYKNFKVSEWLKEFERLYKINEWSESTRADNKMLIDKYINPVIGDFKLKQLSILDLQNTLASVSYSRQREKVHTLLKDAFMRAQELKLIDIITKNNFKKPKHENKERKALTKNEEIAFLKQAENNKYSLAFKISLFQGLRLEEVLALNFEDIDMKNKTLSINKAINRKGEIISTKTKASKRTIPLFKRTYEALLKITFNNDKMFNVSMKNLQKHFCNVRDKAEIKEFTFHGLRHTFGTRCAEAGISAKQTQLWMGHADIETTLKYYTHINKEFEQKNIQDFNTHFDTQFSE